MKNSFKEQKIELRKYESTDCQAVTALFYRTVHVINAKDYAKAQLDVWAPNQVDLKAWNQTLQRNYSLVAVIDQKIVGFGDITQTGYLDHLFVHADYQRRGIATAICRCLEQVVENNITTQASITAKPFFEKRGYRVIKQQQVKRQGILLTNFLMEKTNI